MRVGKPLSTFMGTQYTLVYDRIMDLTKEEALILSFTAKDSLTPRKVASAIRVHLRRRKIHDLYVVVVKKNKIYIQFRDKLTELTEEKGYEE